jgi:hypothetical protein
LHTFLYSETSRNDYFHDSHKFWTGKIVHWNNNC